jgi:Tol biopolymer transport system component
VSVHTRRSRFFAASVIGAVVFAVVPAIASATPPGTNGRLVIRQYFNADHTNGALFTINPDGSHLVQITFPAANVLDTEPDWSPDGTRMAFERRTFCGDECETDELYVVNADGSNIHPIATPTPTVESPAWSPDGQQIAFALATGAFVNDMPADVSIWEIGADGSGLRQITHPVGFQQSEDHGVQFSPDGSRLVIERQLASCGFCPAIFTVDATDGSHATRVSPRGLNGMDHPDWSPDGQWVMFRTESGRGGSSKTFVAHPDGTRLQAILEGTRNGQVFMSSSFSPDGHQMTIAITPGVGPDGNADVWTGTFNSQEQIVSLTPVTRTDVWESSTDWGTAPLIH